MADIIKIKKDGVVQYPITKPECVIDENGKNVLQLIRENAGGDPYDDTELRQEVAELSARIDDIGEGAVAITNEEITEIINMVFGGGGYGYYGVGIGIGDWDY